MHTDQQGYACGVSPDKSLPAAHTDQQVYHSAHTQQGEQRYSGFAQESQEVSGTAGCSQHHQ
jgi:hypothetical protein